MGRIIAVEYLSLDGVDEDPGPTGEFKNRGWTMPYWSDELATHQSDVFFPSEALLLGRVTYEQFAAAWPTRSGDPFTDKMNSMPKYVASRTLREPLMWNASLLKGDVVPAVKKLKKDARKDLIIYGSSQLVRELMRHNLIDVYRLMLYPVVLGGGKRYFHGGDKTPFTLKSAATTSTGVVVLTYEAAATK